MLAVVDASVLFAAADIDAASHAPCSALLSRADLELALPALIVAEASYLMGKRLGQRAESAFVRGLADEDVHAPNGQQWRRIADLVDEYADLPLATADASIVALCEELSTDLVLTLDRRHFEVVRLRRNKKLRILP